YQVDFRSHAELPATLPGILKPMCRHSDAWPRLQAGGALRRCRSALRSAGRFPGSPLPSFAPPQSRPALKPNCLLPAAHIRVPAVSPEFPRLSAGDHTRNVLRSDAHAFARITSARHRVASHAPSAPALPETRAAPVANYHVRLPTDPATAPLPHLACFCAPF